MNFAERFDLNLSNDSSVSIGGERFSFDSKPGFVQHHDSSKVVIVPDAHLLFSGEYMRIGHDLIISGADQKFVVGNYFKGESRPALASKDGATLSGQIVDALTGHIHYAQAGAPAAGAADVIGHVLKLAGSATAIRNGVSIELHIGDAVQKGDVIQTGSDSSVGLTFVDGSAFGMTSNARMVLNEMIFDPNGSSNSSLISLVQGTITFVAGQTAKNGNMRVETPVATMGIRGTAVLVEIAANDGPTKFSVLVEPDGHTGSYNLYDKTSGQLIGTVSQAGQVTFVSSLGLGQPPSAVEQLKTLQDQQAEKAIIQQVFQLYFPNYNPDDSKPNSTKHGSTSGNNLAEIIINTSTSNGQASISQIELRFVPADPNAGGHGGTSRVFYNTKAVFSADAVKAEQSFVTSDTMFKVADVVHIDDPDIGNAPFYDIPIPFVANSAVIKSAVSSISFLDDAFLKPLLHIDQTTGVISFDRLKFNFLGAGETVTFKVEVLSQSGPDSAHVVIPITITGTNDAPVIVAGALTTITGGVTEDVHVNTSGALTTDGVITFQDVDLTDTHTASVALTSTSSTLPGFVANTTQIGTFTIDPVSESNTDTGNTGTVGWHFNLPDDNPILQSLAVGQTITQIYTITIRDQHGVEVPQTVTVTITGTNDVPVITAGSVHTDTIYEIPGQTGGLGFDHNAGGQTPAGSIHFADVDLIDRPDATTISQVVVYMAANGVDVLTLTGVQILAIKNAFALAQSGNTNNGVVGWTYKLPDNILDFMSQGETIQLVSTVQIEDHHGGTATATVTINIIGGSNDTPNITSVTGLALQELNTPVHDTVTVNFTDVDLTQTGHTASVSSVAVTGVVPPGTIAGQTYTSGQAFLGLLTTAAVVKNSGDSAGHATFNFDAAPGVFDYLAAGEVVTLTYTVAVTDSNAASDTHTVTVTVTGTNDAPVINVIAATPLSEQTDTNALTLASPIHVTFTDVDLNDVGHTAAITAVTTAGVTTGLSLTPQQLIDLVTPISAVKAAGSSTGSVDIGFSAASTIFDYLAAGQKLTLTYTVAVNDGDNGVATRNFDITITGTNDDPVIGVAKLTGAVTEDATLPAQTGSETATGTIAFSDVDLTDTHVVSASFKSSDYSTQLGSLVAVRTDDTTGGTGGLITWTFTATDAATNRLAAGQVVHETYTVIIDDGHGGLIPRDVVIAITGANDDGLISVAASDHDTGAVTEDAHSGHETTSGTLSFSDVDLIDVHTVSAVPVGTTLGMLTAIKTADTTGGTSGQVTWTYDVPNSAIQYLAAGEHKDETFTVSVFDGTSTITKDIVVTINGTNDAPVIAADVAGTAGTNVHDLQEGNGGLSTNGTLAVSDADVTNTVAASVFALAVSGTGASSLPLALDASALKAMFSVDAGDVIDNTNTTGTIHWSFNSGAQPFDFLADGKTLILTYTVRATDSDLTHATGDQTVVVQITGTNDAPGVSGAVTATVVEDGIANTLDALANASDADDGHVLSVVSIPTLPAGVSYDAVHHTFTLDPTDAAYQHLGASDSTVVTVNYGVSDGIAATPTAASVSWTITGTNDAPVASPVVLASGTEDTAYIIHESDLLAGVTDVDGPITSISALTIGSGGGTLVDNHNHTWIYTPAQDFNGDVTFNYTATDGSLTAGSVATLHVDAVNDAPVANEDHLIISSDAFDTSAPHTLSISDALLLLNDTDAEGDTLTVASVQNGTGGTAAHSGTDVVYSRDTLPEQGSQATDTFLYKAADASDTSNVATVNLTIVGADATDPLHHTLVGTSANETFIAGSGADTFVFTAGFNHDTIKGFDLNQDAIQIDGVTQSILDLYNHATVANGGADALITPDAGHPADTILLKGITVQQLHDHLTV